MITLNKILRYDPIKHATAIEMLGAGKTIKEITAFVQLSKTAIHGIKKKHFPERVKIQNPKAIVQSSEFFEWW